MSAPTPTGTEGAQAVDAARQLLNSVRSLGWVPTGLSPGDLSALSTPMRPIDGVTAAGQGWLVPYLQPLQDVLDQLAGQATQIQAYAQAWQQAADKVDEVQTQLARLAAGDATDWGGDAFARYQQRAQEIQQALAAAGYVCAANSLFAQKSGEVIADARRQINELFTGLVTRLVSYVNQAMAAHGGQLTPEIPVRCQGMINNTWRQIQIVRELLNQALQNLVAPPPTPGDTDWLGLTVQLVSLVLLPWTKLTAAARGVLAGIRLLLRLRRASTPPPPKQMQQPVQQQQGRAPVRVKQGRPTDRLKEHLTDRDLDAARRELKGEVVARKRDGTPFDHVDEVRNAQNGLRNRIADIKNRLEGSYQPIPPGERAALESELSEASRLLDHSEQFVPR